MTWTVSPKVDWCGSIHFLGHAIIWGHEPANFSDPEDWSDMTSLRPAKRPQPPSPSNLPLCRPPRCCWLIDVNLCHLLVYDVFLGLVRPNRREGADRPNPCATARAKPPTPIIPPHVHYNEVERGGWAMCGRCPRGVTRGQSSGGASYIIAALSFSVVVGLYWMRDRHVTTARQ